MEVKKRSINDAMRFHTQARASTRTIDDSRKADNNLEELNEGIVELISSLYAACRRRTTLTDCIAADTVGFNE